MPYMLVDLYRRFRGACWLHLYVEESHFYVEDGVISLTAPFSPFYFGRHFIAVVFINADYDYSLAVVITGTF
jgi:hypothetical protein